MKAHLSYLFLAGVAIGFAQQAGTGDAPRAPETVVSRPRRLAPVQTSPRLVTIPGWYDVSNRSTIRDNWNLVFAPTISVPTGWTGSVDANIPGTTTQAFKDAVVTRINWFRAMAGVPTTVTLDPTYSGKDQQAALMFSANRSISHTPPTNWVDYTPEAAEAAGNSNICYGYFNDPGCVLAYIVDTGSNNAIVGHRRWVLYPQTLHMGTGDVPQSGSAQNPYPPANALWVFDGNYGTTRPATRDPYVAWPPPGYVPYQVVGPRWSFSYPNADFTNASVSMTRNGQNVPVQLGPVATGYGENTLIWVPDNLNTDGFTPVAPASDTTSTVTITNVLINGSPQSFQYSVIVFDPNSSAGATFSFSPTSQNIAATATTGTANLTVSPSNTTWSAISSAPWLSLTSGAGGTGSGTIGWSAAANPNGLSRSATITVSGAVFTVTQAGVPCSYSIVPSSVTIPAAGGSGSVLVTATPADCASVSTSSTGSPSITVSTAYGNGSITFNYTASANTTTQTLQQTITFADRTVILAQPPAPVATSLTPNSGSGATQTFTGVYTDGAGYTNLRWVQMLFAVATDGGGQSYCFVHYDVQGNGLWLYGDGGFFVGPVAPHAASNLLQNSLCALNTSGSTVTGSATTLTIQPNIVFKQAGARNIYMRTMDQAGNDTGWVQKGTWTAAAASTGTLSLSPSSGSGSTQTFTLTYPDPPGFAGAAFGWTQFLVAAASDGGGQPFCFVHYDRGGNGLWMYSSDVGFFLGPVTPGTASSALNSSACSVNTAGATVNNTGGNLVVTVPVTMKAPMSGSKKTFQRTLDVLNRDTGWQQTGTWIIP